VPQEALDDPADGRPIVSPQDQQEAGQQCRIPATNLLRRQIVDGEGHAETAAQRRTEVDHEQPSFTTCARRRVLAEPRIHGIAVLHARARTGRQRYCVLARQRPLSPAAAGEGPGATGRLRQKSALSDMRSRSPIRTSWTSPRSGRRRARVGGYAGGPSRGLMATKTRSCT